jgi:hypothetical protein
VSARKAWLLTCDGCGESDEGDLSAETAAERRAEAQFDGWHVGLLGGRDLCPSCWDEGVR